MFISCLFQKWCYNGWHHCFSKRKGTPKIPIVRLGILMRFRMKVMKMALHTNLLEYFPHRKRTLKLRQHQHQCASSCDEPWSVWGWSVSDRCRIQTASRRCEISCDASDPAGTKTSSGTGCSTPCAACSPILASCHLPYSRGISWDPLQSPGKHKS